MRYWTRSFQCYSSYFSENHRHITKKCFFVFMPRLYALFWTRITRTATSSCLSWMLKTTHRSGIFLIIFLGRVRHHQEPKVTHMNSSKIMVLGDLRFARIKRAKNQEIFACFLQHRTGQKHND